MLLHRGDGDAMLCGTFGRHKDHLRHVAQRHRPAARRARIFAAMNVLMLPNRTLFICDTYVNEDPTRRAAGRDHVDGGRGSAALRSDAESRAAVALELRQRTTRRPRAR